MSENKPDDLSNVYDLYDDGKYSVISGSYENKPVLTHRWKWSNNRLGLPLKIRYEVAPIFLQIPILQSLLSKLKRDKDIPNRNKYIDTVTEELGKREAL